MVSDFQNIEEKFFIVNDLKIHTIISGQGEPIFLLHGFPDFWYGWKKIIDGLNDEFRLIVPDLRGYNLSDKPNDVEEYQVEYLIDDVKKLSQKLNIEKFTLVGHDWGGVISWIFAENYPGLLNKLIILNAPHPKIFQDKLKTSDTQKKASSYIFEFLKPNGEKNLLRNNYQLLKLAVFGTAKNRKAFSEEDKQKYVEAWSQPGAITAGVNYYRANRTYEGLTGNVNVPTLVMHGLKDRFVTPRVLDGLSEYVEDLKVKKNPKASHWIMHDDPDFVIKNIREFVKT
ncbi:MAG: alpha/beta fold hydrolase [Candidatus Lokiarchaeota archaeon]|nr:alpha/beta fold hydrolase [Candidatus Lokiarchaeota archaeon]